MNLIINLNYFHTRIWRYLNGWISDFMLESLLVRGSVTFWAEEGRESLSKVTQSLGSKPPQFRIACCWSPAKPHTKKMMAFN